MSAAVAAGRRAVAWAAVGAALLHGVRLWVSVCLALGLAYWMDLQNPFWAGTSAALVCQPTIGTSLRKASYRVVGTFVGAAAAVLILMAFPQSRWGLVIALAAWCGVCGAAATWLRNFSSYAAALAGYTALIVATDALANPPSVFLVAVWRATEIILGIVSAGLVLTLTDRGDAQTRAFRAIGAISHEIWSGYVGLLERAGLPMGDGAPVRRALSLRVVPLGVLLDEAAGESSVMRVGSGALQSGVAGLLRALAAWRASAVHLERLPPEVAGREAAGARGLVAGAEPPFGEDPAAARARCAAIADAPPVPGDKPGARLVLAATRRLASGLAEAANGLVLLGGGQAERRRGHLPVLADPLPALLNGVRCLVAVLALAVFWILSQWPSGPSALVFAGVVLLLLSPQGEGALHGSVEFLIGTVAATGLAAVLNFALLPGAEGFGALCALLAVFLIPSAAMSAGTWHRPLFVAMSANFIPVLGPANLPNYDTVAFYDSALAIGVGVGAGALFLALIPALDARARTARLLRLTLRDVRRVAAGRRHPSPGQWERRLQARLGAMQADATMLQIARLITAFALGAETIRLRAWTARVPALRAGLAAIARGELGAAEARLAEADDALARAGEASAGEARGGLILIREALRQHGDYLAGRSVVDGAG